MAWKRFLQQREGYAMVAAILTVALVLMAGLAILGRATTEQKLSKSQVDSEKASYAAMAGLEDGMGFVVWDATFSDVAPATFPSSFYNIEKTVGDSKYNVTATWVNAEEIEVRSEGTSGPASRPARKVAVARLLAPVSNGLGTTPTGGTGGGPAGGSTPTEGTTSIARTVGFADIDMQSFTWGGGTFDLQANAPFKGNIYVNGDITISGDVDICGHLYATGDIEVTGSASFDVNAETCPEYWNLSAEERTHARAEDIGRPTFDFAMPEDHAEIDITGDTALKCTPTDYPRAGDSDVRSTYCDNSGSAVRVVYIDGDLDLKKYSYAKNANGKGGQQQVDVLTFSGEIIYVVSGKIKVDGVEIFYETPDTRVQFVSLHDGADAITINGNNDGSGAEGNTVVNGTFVAPNGGVTSKNSEMHGLVFAEAWSAQGPTDYIAQGRLWTTVNDYYDDIYDNDDGSDGSGGGGGTGGGDGSGGSDGNQNRGGWSIKGMWHE